MNIQISRKEYRTLLEILEIADWVLHAHKTQEDSGKKRYLNLEQKIFSYAVDIGFGNLIEYDDHLGGYFPTREYEEESPAMKYVEEFENEGFWDELIERLVRRDLIRQEGEDKFLNMDMEERFQKEELMREK